MPVNPTSAQSDASRLNGSLSHGPVTAEGRARSSMNSLDLGLCSKQLILPGESADFFDALLESFVEEYKPNTPTEDVLVEELAVAKWRLDRVRTAQHRALADIDLSAALDDDKLARKLNNLHRYESQYRRQFDRALRQLQEIRAIAKQEQKLEADAREQELRSRERRVKTLLAIKQRQRRHDRTIPVSRMSTRLQNEPKPTSGTSVGNEPEIATAAA